LTDEVTVRLTGGLRNERNEIHQMWGVGIKGRINMGLVCIRIGSVLGIAYVLPRSRLFQPHPLLFGEEEGRHLCRSTLFTPALSASSASRSSGTLARAIMSVEGLRCRIAGRPLTPPSPGKPRSRSNREGFRFGRLRSKASRSATSETEKLSPSALIQRLRTFALALAIRSITDRLRSMISVL
jgi:hypothetical protein